MKRFLVILLVTLLTPVNVTAFDINNTSVATTSQGIDTALGVDHTKAEEITYGDKDNISIATMGNIELTPEGKPIFRIRNSNYSYWPGYKFFHRENSVEYGDSNYMSYPDFCDLLNPKGLKHNVNTCNQLIQLSLGTNIYTKSTPDSTIPDYSSEIQNLQNINFYKVNFYLKVYTWERVIGSTFWEETYYNSSKSANRGWYGTIDENITPIGYYPDKPQRLDMGSLQNKFENNNEGGTL